ncbi:hypothetical protein PM082_004411 [Marasmius tenuissimus]|nr:hypothetical protein PM082_004411 [Marasmius tenuissimus]
MMKDLAALTAPLQKKPPSNRPLTDLPSLSPSGVSSAVRPASRSMTDPSPYNLTIPSQTASLTYDPQRGPNSSASDGWELWYSAIDERPWIRQGQGADFHISTKAGASVNFNWLGTAIYVYGAGTKESYRFSVDGQDIGQTFDVQEGGLLGSKDGMQYKEHNATLKVIGQEMVAFQYADLTIGLGYPGNENKNQTIPAVIEDGRSVQPNPFFVFQNDSLGWRLDSNKSSIPSQDGSFTRITRQMLTDKPNDRLSFNVNSTSALILWGSFFQDHLPKRVTIFPDPRSNSSDVLRSTDIYDISQYLDYQQVLYWESGLDRNKEYTVEVSNIVSRSDPMMLAFNELQLLDGGPPPPPPPVSSVPPDSEPTGQLVVAHHNHLAAKYIAVIVVLSILFLVAVGVGAFWFCKRAKRKRGANVIYNGVLDDEPTSHPPVALATSRSFREIDAGPLPPQYDHSWASVPTGDGSEASTPRVQTSEVAQNGGKQWKKWADKVRP